MAQEFFHKDIVELARNNDNYRKVIATGKFSQVVLMSILSKSEIGSETHHDVDQILIFVQGTGTAYLNEEQYSVGPGDAVFVPAGTKHNFINTGAEDLKLYTIYAPAEHKPGIVRETKEEADRIPE
jgi:mannose-6-phosphate isomerase-like protein (cupin superfamily)